MPTQRVGTLVPIVGRAEQIKRLLKRRAVVAESTFVVCPASDRQLGKPSNSIVISSALQFLERNDTVNSDPRWKPRQLSSAKGASIVLR